MCLLQSFPKHTHTHNAHTHTHTQTQLPSEKSLLFCSKICFGCENEDTPLRKKKRNAKQIHNLAQDVGES